MLYSRCVSFANLIIFHQARFPSIQWILKNKLGKVETTQLLEDVEFCQSNSSSSKRCAPSSNSSTPLSIGWATPPFFAPVLMVLWHTVFFIRNPQNSEKVPKNPKNKSPFKRNPRKKRNRLFRQGTLRHVHHRVFVVPHSSDWFLWYLDPQLRWSFAAVSGWGGAPGLVFSIKKRELSKSGV